MTSGWSRHRSILKAGEAARVARFVEEGRTVELRDLAKDDRVIVIALGFGDEYWRVHAGSRAHPFETRVDGGELIVDGGARVTDGGRLSFLKHPIVRVVYAV